MISAFFGVPGSGKTTALAWVANKAVTRPNRPIYLCGVKVSDGHPVTYSNFQFPGCYKLDYELLGVADYRDCNILIDEAMMYSDCRDFKAFSERLKFFYSQHRKFNVDVIWCSQSYDDTDKKIRNLTVNFFHVIPLAFSFFRITHIEPFFDIVNTKIASGYDFGRSQFIYGRPLFRLFNSFATVKHDALTEPPKDSW